VWYLRRLIVSPMPVKSLVQVGFFLLLPAGAHGFREAETTKCAFAFGRHASGRGRRADAGRSRRALESPALRARCPVSLRLDYAAVAVA